MEGCIGNHSGRILQFNIGELNLQKLSKDSEGNGEAFSNKIITLLYNIYPFNALKWKIIELKLQIVLIQITEKLFGAMD